MESPRHHDLAARKASAHTADREEGLLVYPVFSRRSGGLSLGVNLFPEGKDCSFDCPYCEVYPFSGPRPFDVGRLREELEAFAGSREEMYGSHPVRDICLAGRGEPSLSPRLPEALATIAEARRRFPEALGRAELVIITNSTGFLAEGVPELLHRFVEDEGLVVWAKLDAGTAGYYKRINRCPIPFDRLLDGILSFARRSPIIIQTMFCELEGEAPGAAEISAYAGVLAGLARSGARIREVQLYTQARPAPEGITAAIADAELLRFAAIVRKGLSFPVKAFGSAGELSFDGPTGEPA